MTENLQQLRIHDPLLQADGTYGSYIVPGQGGTFEYNSATWPDLWGEFSSTGNPAILRYAEDGLEPTVYYNFWAADNFGTSEYNICPP